MPSGAEMSLFLVAAFVLLITPGPAVTYIVARSLSQGRTAGLVSSLGIGLGGLLHVTAAALGLSAIIASSALAFSVLKYAGAAYLIWLGMQRLFGGSDEVTDPAPVRESLRRIFWQGAVVNALNPKAALFFLAFLPQFVNPQGSLVPQDTLPDRHTSLWAWQPHFRARGTTDGTRAPRGTGDDLGGQHDGLTRGRKKSPPG
jgi:threonine/homoserine/homoserine lactone efflux protein